MGMTERRIRQIIKEEATRILRESEESEDNFDGPGVGQDVVSKHQSDVRRKSGEEIRGMLESISQIVMGENPPGVAHHYPGWNRDDFALLLVEVLWELGARPEALKKAIEKY